MVANVVWREAATILESMGLISSLMSSMEAYQSGSHGRASGTAEDERPWWCSGRPKRPSWALPCGEKMPLRWIDVI